MAWCGDDFDALYREVFRRDSARRLTAWSLRMAWPSIVGRHRQLLARLGLPNGRYPMVYSRPSGGGAYRGRPSLILRRYHLALAQLGMFNVMWDRQAGDVRAEHARDFGFLLRNIVSTARHWGCC